MKTITKDQLAELGFKDPDSLIMEGFIVQYDPKEECFILSGKADKVPGEWCRGTLSEISDFWDYLNENIGETIVCGYAGKVFYHIQSCPVKDRFSWFCTSEKLEPHKPATIANARYRAKETVLYGSWDQMSDMMMKLMHDSYERIGNGLI